MSELNQRVRAYLDKKKSRPTESVTDDVRYIPSADRIDAEAEQAWQDFKRAIQGPLKFIKFSTIIAGVIFVMWALAVIDIQNDCWLNKECREWVKNR